MNNKKLEYSMELKRFPSIKTIISNDFFDKKIIFELITENKKTVYMSHSVTIRGGIIFVNSERFLKLWRNSLCDTDKEISNLTKEGWRRDYKFHWAEDGFRKGIENPVPLADICCTAHIIKESVYAKYMWVFRKQISCKEKKYYSCSFVDGITRTIWLLSNGVQSFPLHCYDSNETKYIAKLAGITENAYYIGLQDKDDKSEIEDELGI